MSQSRHLLQQGDTNISYGITSPCAIIRATLVKTGHYRRALYLRCPNRFSSLPRLDIRARYHKHHMRHSLTMLHNQCKFGRNRLVIKATLLFRTKHFLFVSRLMLQGCDTNITYCTIYQCAASSASFAEIGQKRRAHYTGG
jgi:hypothetical protein